MISELRGKSFNMVGIQNYITPVLKDISIRFVLVGLT